MEEEEEEPTGNGEEPGAKSGKEEGAFEAHVGSAPAVDGLDGESATFGGGAWRKKVCEEASERGIVGSTCGNGNMLAPSTPGRGIAEVVTEPTVACGKGCCEWTTELPATAVDEEGGIAGTEVVGTAVDAAMGGETCDWA